MLLLLPELELKAVGERQAGPESFASSEESLYYFLTGDETQYSEKFYSNFDYSDQVCVSFLLVSA